MEETMQHKETGIMRQWLRINNVRLRNKMLILYVFSVLVPILCTNVIFYVVMTNNVKEQRMTDISRAVQQVRNDFRAEVDDIVGLSTVFYTDYILNEILEEEYEQPHEYVAAYDSYLRRVLYNPIYHAVQTVTVYTDNPTVLYSGGIGLISEQIKQTEWYKLANDNDRSYPVFMRTESNTGVKDTFSIIRVMDYYSSLDVRHKIIKIDFRTDQIRQIFSNLNLQGHIYLLNPEGDIEFTTNPSIDWSREVVPYTTLDKDNVEFIETFTTDNYLKGWSLIGTIAVDEVFREVNKSKSFVIWAASIVLILPTLVIILMTRSISSRVVRILRHMKKAGNQNFDTMLQIEERDEIGQLSVEFNRMINKIKSLIDDVYIADIQKTNLELQHRNAQLNALQSQINPHFLFNALETIRMRSLMKNETETAKIIHNMAKIFRTSLTWGKDRVTVKEEMEFILCFLEIQKYRFEDRLNYQIEIDPQAYDCTVPKMMFLPFVENASIHGIEPLKKGGDIHVQIECEQDSLVFSIRDNGVGMSPEHVHKLYGYMKSEEDMGDRIGVQNVIYRLKLVYGDRFSFHIDSDKGKGTYIRILIPMTIRDN
jgi:two-component system sensor histidine kinase YesM